MSTSESSSTLVIVNPGAGGVAGSTGLADVLGPLGFPRVVETDGPGHATELASGAVARGTRLVVVVGGDGTLHEVVNGLGPGGACALGILPAGTGNDTARSLDIPFEHGEAVRVIAERDARPTDLMAVQADGREEWAINAACGGFGGEVNERMTDELKERWGPLSYIRTAADALAEIPVHRVRLRVDGSDEVALAVHSLVVANGAYAARGVRVAPGAEPDDGSLAVHAVLEAPMSELLAMVPSVLRGQAPESGHYRVWAGAEVEVRCDETMGVSVDGELLKGRRFRYRAVPGALDVHRP